MARKQTTIVKCDNPSCKVYAEVAEMKETPEGWWRIGQSDLHQRTTNGFDLCSVKCVEQWAKARRALALNQDSRSNGREDPKRAPQGSHRGANDNVELIHMALEEAHEPLTSTQIQSLVGLSQSVVDRHLATLLESRRATAESKPGKSPNGFIRFYSVA